MSVLNSYCLIWHRTQQQQEVLAWLLEPLSQQWTQSEWQDKYLSDPQGLIGLCSEAPVMWSIFHTVTFFEKALKRSGLKKAYGNSENSSTPHSTPSNPMASHVLWMLPPLLKVCAPPSRRRLGLYSFVFGREQVTLF